MLRLNQLESQFSSIEQKQMAKQACVFNSKYIEIKKVQEELNVITLQLKANVMNINVIDPITEVLFEKNKNENRIFLLKSCNPATFCVGGDVKSMQLAMRDHNDPKTFARVLKERLVFDHQFYKFNSNKKQNLLISFYRGLNIGGGYCLSMTSNMRIVEPNTQMYFPEIRIGLIVPTMPFFASLQSFYGLFLALTGFRIKSGQELVQLGLADYSFLKNELFDEFQHTLENKIQLKKQNQSVDEFMKKEISSFFAQNQEYILNSQNCGDFKYKNEILELFSNQNFESFWKNINSVAKNEGNKRDPKIVKFAQETLAQMSEGSPIALKLNFVEYWNMFNRLKQCKDQNTLDQIFKLGYDNEYKYNINLQKYCKQDFIDGTQTVLYERDRKPEFFHKSVDQLTTDLEQKIYDFDYEKNFQIESLNLQV